MPHFGVTKRVPSRVLSDELEAPTPTHPPTRRPHPQSGRLRMIATLVVVAVVILAGYMWESNRPRALVHLEPVDLFPFHSPIIRDLTVCESNALGLTAMQLSRAPLSIDNAHGGDTGAALLAGEKALFATYSVFAAADILLGERRRLLTYFFEDDRVMCVLALLYLNNCDEDGETVLGCMRRIGADNMRLLMPRRCASTRVFSDLLEAVRAVDAKCGVPAGRPAAARDLALGEVEDTLLVHLDTPRASRLRERLLQPDGPAFMERVLGGRDNLTAEEQDAVREAFYVPVDDRPAFQMPKPLRCTPKSRGASAEVVNHPMGFALSRRPRSTTYPKNKLFEFFPILPSVSGSILTSLDENTNYLPAMQGSDRVVNEWVYAVLMRYSMFAFTHKRGGYDCLRTLEITHYGAVPVFADLRAAPFRTSSTSPRDLLLRVLDDPLLSHLGYVDERGRLYPSAADRKGPSYTQTHFYRKCVGTALMVFRRPGTVNVTPFAAAHAADVAAGRARGPLTFRSPAVRRHYDSIAQPLWNLTDTHYSAASVVNYILHTVGCREPRRVLVIGDSAFDSDYTHEAVVIGLGELGIPSDVYVRKEGNKFQRLSFGGGPPAPSSLQAYMGDPREVGMPALESARLGAAAGFTQAFSSAGRYNPFVTRRVGGLQAYTTGEEQTLGARRDVEPVLEQRLRDGQYDLVIYTVLSEDTGFLPRPCFATVKEVMSPNRVVFIDHNDLLIGVTERIISSVAGHGHLFTRESIGRCPRTHKDTTAAGNLSAPFVVVKG